MDTDRNLLFGVLALQADLIDANQFAEACTAWSARKDLSLADLLLQRGWLTADDCRDVQRLLERKLKKHAGDARQSLALNAGNDALRVLALLNDSAIQQSLAALPAPQHIQLSTVPPPQDVRNRYSLVRLHAEGGIGRVWLARDSAIGRDIALKELLPGRADEPQLLARFVAEAQVTGQLEHPGIVPVYELAAQMPGESPFYTMRFVRGRTLGEAVRTFHDRQKCGEAGTLDLLALLNSFVAVCQAVAYAHSRGVIHRDLKPSNVVVGNYGEVMVLDWGLAKVQGREEEATRTAVVVPDSSSEAATLEGQVLGTPAYMAPEQAQGKVELVDARSDVYGLGAILYEILTGRPPFTGRDTYSVLAQVIHEPPVRPRAIWPGAPSALEAVCLRALAKVRTERYSTAEELAGEVQRWLADEPVTAYREPLPVRLGRWARKHRSAVSSAAALLLSAVAALTISLVLIGKEKNRAEANFNAAQANFRLARTAVERYYTRVSQRLLNVPGMQPLRKELLSTAREFYQNFVTEHGDDPGLRADLANAYHQLATITNQMGSQKEALALYQQAVDLYQRLALDNPTITQHRSDLAVTSRALGSVYQDLGRLDEAESAIRFALHECERLAQELPGQSPLRRDLAACHLALGRFFHQARRQTDLAEAAYRHALAVLADLVAQNPDDLDCQCDLAFNHGLLGSLYQSTGQLNSAGRAFQEARTIQERLVQKQPDVTSHQYELAGIYNNLGLNFQMLAQNEGDEKKYQQALDVQRKAQAIREQLVRTNPTVVDYQRDLAASHRALGILFAITGQMTAAQQSFEQATRLREQLVRDHPETVHFKAELGTSYVNTGILFATNAQHQTALQWYDRAVDQLTAVLKLEPRHALAREVLSNTHFGRALALSGLGRHLDAVEAWRLAETFDVRKEKALLHFSRLMAAAQHRGILPSFTEMSDHAGATEKANAFARRGLLPGITFFHLACVFALSSSAAEQDTRLPKANRLQLSEQYAARAVELLGKARTTGLFRTAAYRQELLTRPELNALRSRSDFRALLATLPTDRSS